MGLPNWLPTMWKVGAVPLLLSMLCPSCSRPGFDGASRVGRPGGTACTLVGMPACGLMLLSIMFLSLHTT